MVENGQVVEILIEGLGSSGEGIGSYRGFKIFAQGGLPGERIRVKIQNIKSNYATAKLLELLQKSPLRVEPICPLFNQCGGCQLMHLEYEHQLEIKKKKVADAFIRIGKSKIEEDFEVVPSTSSLHYRNKIQLPASKIEGSLKLGLYAKNSHEVIAVDRCYIHSDLGQQVYEKISQILQEFNIEPYDEKTKSGELRHVLMRSSFYTNEVLVVLITAKTPSSKIRHIAKEIASINQVKGVVHHRNQREDNVVFDKEFTLLEGSSSIKEKICGLEFNISGASFFQVNTQQAENLYRYALQIADLDRSMVVLDAYCGIGTLSLQIASSVKKVIGVECVFQAIEDAKVNAKNNNINNTEFICGTTEKVITQLTHLDRVFLNPPRKGCDPHVLNVIAAQKVKKIVYISCDPATLARDVKILESFGYKKEKVKAFDLFPQTMHVETVALLVYSK